MILSRNTRKGVTVNRPTRSDDGRAEREVMKITDSKRTVEIRMMVWENNNYSPDWSNDFFDAGLLNYDEDIDAYIVDDVDYCIDQAQEWAAEDENNTVFVEEVNNDRY